MPINYLKNSVIYIIINIVQKSSSFLMVPIYTSYITPNKLGIFSLTQSFSAFFIVLFTFGLDEAAIVFFFKNQENKKQLKSILGNIILLSLGISVLGLIILVFFQKQLFFNTINGISYEFVYMAIILILTSPFYNIYQKMLRIQNKALHHAFFLAFYSIFQMVLLLIFIVYFKLDVIGLMLAFTLTSFVFGLYSLYKVTSISNLNFDKEIVINVMNYSKHIAINGLLSWGITNLMIISLGKFSNSHQVGIYTAISFFGMILLEFSKTFVNIYQPFVYESIKNSTSSSKLYSVTKLVCLSILLFAITLTIFSEAFFHFFINSMYKEGLELIPLVVGIGLINFYTIMVDQIFGYFENETKKMSWSSITGFILNVALIFYFRNVFNLKVALLILNIVLIFILILKTYYLNKILNYNLGYIWIKAAIFIMPFYIFSIIDHTFLFKSSVLAISIFLLIVSEKTFLFKLYNTKKGE